MAKILVNKLSVFGGQLTRDQLFVPKTAGLTKKIFLACIQSLGAMIELASYLHHQHEFRYVTHRSMVPRSAAGLKSATMLVI